MNEKMLMNLANKIHLSMQAWQKALQNSDSVTVKITETNVAKKQSVIKLLFVNNMNANEFENDIQKCLQVLKSGGIILYPTDTIWGIGCDATNEEAVEKIISLKERPVSKSFVVLVADERDIMKYIAAPDLSVFDYLQTTIKPTTVIYENAIGLAPNVLADDGSVAIRICYEPFFRHLIKRYRKPIVSTSANLSGEHSPQIFAEINKRIIEGVDYTVNYRQNDITKAQPSSIIKWKKGKPIIIRG